MSYPLAHEIRTSVSKRLGYHSNLYRVEGEANAFVYCYSAAGRWPAPNPHRVIQVRIVGRRGTSVAFVEETDTPSAGLPLVVRRSS